MIMKLILEYILIFFHFFFIHFFFNFEFFIQNPKDLTNLLNITHAALIKLF